MLINRIHRSMNRVLEGVDRCEPYLILEATKEFEAATAELIKDIEGLRGVVSNIKELSLFDTVLQGLIEPLKSIDFSDISDEYSFTDHYKMMSAEPRNNSPENPNPEYEVSYAATNYATSVNGIKGGIMVIAKWAEQFPEVFSVGKNGIVFQKAFGDIVSAKNPELRVKDMCGSDQLGILQAMTATEDEEEIKEIFKSIWLPEGTEKEKEDEAWTKFTGGFEKLGQAGKAAYDTAKTEIKDTDPPKEVQQTGNASGGFLKSLLGNIIGEGAENISDMGWMAEQILGQSIDGDNGLFAMTFVDLQQLITKILEFVGSSAAAGAKALQAVDNQTQETMKPEDNQGKLWDLFNDSELKMKKEDITKVGLALEQVGWDKNKDWNSLDKAKVEESLMKVFNKDEAKTKAVMEELYPNDNDADIDVEELKSELEELNISDDFNDGLQALLDRMIDDEGNPKEDISAEEAKQEIQDAAPEDEELPDDFQSELVNLLSDENIEENLYRRWGRIAGILKD